MNSLNVYDLQDFYRVFMFIKAYPRDEYAPLARKYAEEIETADKSTLTKEQNNLLERIGDALNDFSFSVIQFPDDATQQDLIDAKWSATAWKIKSSNILRDAKEELFKAYETESNEQR